MNFIRLASLLVLLFPTIGHAVTFYADTNGDGIMDTVSTAGSNGNAYLTIFHPNDGTTSTYSFGSGQTYFEVVGPTDTNGVAGQEIIVRAVYSTGLSIYVVDDRNNTKRQYNYGNGLTYFEIVSISNNTDGRPGNEIIMRTGSTSGGPSIRVIEDARQSVRQYDFATGLSFFGIVGIKNTNGLAGDEIVVHLAANNAPSIRVLDDARQTYRQYNFGTGLAYFEVVSITDTNNLAGDEIITRIEASSSGISIRILDDARATYRQYNVGTGLRYFAIAAIKSYDAYPDNEICYIGQTTTSTAYFYRLIVDRTGSILTRSGC